MSSYPCGVTLSRDGKTACVCLSINNTLAVVDLAGGAPAVELPVGVAPYAVVLSPDDHLAYVTNWGGRRSKKGEKTAKSAGTDTLVDDRGVASSGWSTAPTCYPGNASVPGSVSYRDSSPRRPGSVRA